METKKRSKQIGIRLTDRHERKLDEYCDVVGATKTGVINALAESYIQAMIDTGTFIAPSVENLPLRRIQIYEPPQSDPVARVAEQGTPYHNAKKP